MTSDKKALPRWFWLVAGLALLWNIGGFAAFMAQITMSEESLAQLSAAEQQLLANTPFWVVMAFALAVCSGTLGCIMLLLKKRWAQPLFVLSLLAVVIQFGHAFIFADMWQLLGPQGAVLPAFVIIIGVALLKFSQLSNNNRWLS